MASRYKIILLLMSVVLAVLIGVYVTGGKFPSGGAVEEPPMTSDGIEDPESGTGNNSTITVRPSTDSSGSSSTEDSSSDSTTEDEDVTADDFPYFSGNGTPYEDENVYINPVEATVYVGDTFRIKVVATDNSTITYDYFDKSYEYVSVDERGNVTAFAAGTATLLLTIDGRNVLITITVLEVEETAEVMSLI